MVIFCDTRRRRSGSKAKRFPDIELLLLFIIFVLAPQKSIMRSMTLIPINNNISSLRKVVGYISAELCDRLLEDVRLFGGSFFF